MLHNLIWISSTFSTFTLYVWNWCYSVVLRTRKEIRYIWVYKLGITPFSLCLWVLYKKWPCEIVYGSVLLSPFLFYWLLLEYTVVTSDRVHKKQWYIYTEYPAGQVRALRDGIQIFRIQIDLFEYLTTIFLFITIIKEKYIYMFEPEKNIFTWVE